MALVDVVEPEVNQGTCLGQISADDLPSNISATFTDSSFFTRNGPTAKLPTPAEVRERSYQQDTNSQNYTDFSPLVYFEELGLVVDIRGSSSVSFTEGQCLWALRRALPTVPIPEVYGWTYDEFNDQSFIYMKLVPGASLDAQWDDLGPTTRADICLQLKVMVDDMRKLRHAPGESFLGQVNRDPLWDYMFICGRDKLGAGPFERVTELHDWLSNDLKSGVQHLHWESRPLSEIPDPYRSRMPDDAAVVFTHGDLHPRNIMVSTDVEPPQIVAVTNWRGAGWYPDYWEYCKAMYHGEGVDNEWRDVYIPLFLEPLDVTDTFEDYGRSFGY